MHRSFRIILILLIVVMLLCGCSTNPTQTPPPATEPSTAPTIDPNKPLTELTDYELLCVMVEKDAVNNWMFSSYYIPPYGFFTLIRNSPEFAELLTRPTAIDSLRAHITPLAEAHPRSCFDALEAEIPQIEEYISDISTSRAELTDYELLCAMGETDALSHWKFCFSHTQPYDLDILRLISPDFVELMARPTAVDSIRTNIDRLIEDYPDGCFDALESHIPQIEAYISENLTK